MAFGRCPKSGLRDAREARLHTKMAQTSNFYRKQLCATRKSAPAEQPRRLMRGFPIPHQNLLQTVTPESPAPSFSRSKNKLTKRFFKKIQ